MKKLVPFVFAAVVAASLGAASKAADTAKTSLTLRAFPVMAFAPARITLTGQVKGGPDDNSDYYCPTVEWDWGDGTVSEATSDCDPFQPSKSVIQRSYIIQHIYKFGGNYVVHLRLKKQSKLVAEADAVLNLGASIDEGRDIR